MAQQPTRWNVFRVTFVIGLLETGYGLVLYRNPDDFLSLGRASSPHLSLALMIGGVLQLIMARYSQSRRGLWRLLAVVSAAPLLVLAAPLLLGRNEPERLNYAVQGLAALLIPWLPASDGSTPARDLFDRMIALLGLLYAPLFFLAPFGVLPGMEGALYPFLPIAGVASLVAAVGLWLGPGADGNRAGLYRYARVGATGVYLFLLALSFYLNIASGCVGSLVAIVALWVRQKPLPGLQTAVASSPEDSVLAVERSAEVWSWAVLPPALAVGLVDPRSGSDVMLAVSLFVVGLSTYNIVAHWLFPFVGRPETRVKLHLTVFVIALALLYAANETLGHTFLVLMAVPPLLAARALGERSGYTLLAQSILLILGIEVVQFLLHGWDDHPLTEPVMRVLLITVAGWMTVRTAAAQRNLTERVRQTSAELQDANGELSALNEELTAQNEELLQLSAAMERLASYDPLTGLANRRYFREQLELELLRVRETGERGALFYLDLDHFKDVNDSLGHTAGDRVLQQIARVLQAGVRQTDLIARLGGDEFAVLAPGVTRDEAEQLADRIMVGLRQEGFLLDGKPTTITASMGVTLYPEHGLSPEALVMHADSAMYAAKHGGRDGVRLYAGALENR